MGLALPVPAGSAALGQAEPWPWPETSDRKTGGVGQSLGASGADSVGPWGIVDSAGRNCQGFGTVGVIGS